MKSLLYLLFPILLANGLDDRIDNLIDDIKGKGNLAYTSVNGETAKLKNVSTDRFIFAVENTDTKYLVIIKKGKEGYGLVDLDPNQNPGGEIYYEGTNLGDGNSNKLIGNALSENPKEGNFKGYKEIVVFNELNKKQMEELYSKILDEAENEI